MPLNFSDTYGGGQELVNQGSSRITPRETYSYDARTLQSQYADRLKRTNELVDAMSSMTKVANKYEAQVEEEEKKQVEGISSSIIPQLKFDPESGSVVSQISALRPDLNPRLVAATAEAVGRIRADDDARKFFQELYSDKSIANDATATSNAINNWLASKAKEHGNVPFFGANYAKQARATLTQLSNGLSNERTKSMADTIAKDNEARVGDILDGKDVTNTSSVYTNDLDRTSTPDAPSASGMYSFLKSLGATDNEAHVLTGAAHSESGFNPRAPHDNGTGYGMFGHRLERLAAMRQFAGTQTPDWKQQAAFALQELRSRPEGALVNSAKTPHELTRAQMFFERPRGFTETNPEAGHNWSGRLETIKKFSQLRSSGFEGGGGSGGTAVIAMGTNDFSNPAKTYENTIKVIQNAQARGLTPVVIAPNGSSEQFKKVAEEVTRAAKDAGAKVETVQYDPNDPLHMTMDEAKRIAKAYPNAIPIGDSNAVRVGIGLGRRPQGTSGKEQLVSEDGKVHAQTGASTDAILKLMPEAPSVGRYGDTSGLTPDIFEKRRRLLDWDFSQNLKAGDLLSQSQRKEQMIDTIISKAVTANNGFGDVNLLAVLPKRFVGPDGKERDFLSAAQEEKLQKTRTTIIANQRAMAKAVEEQRSALEDANIRDLKTQALLSIQNGEKTPNAAWLSNAQKIGKEDLIDWYSKRALSNYDAMFTDPQYNNVQRMDFERDIRRAVARGDDVESIADKVLATPMHTATAKHLLDYIKSVEGGPVKSILRDTLSTEMEKSLIERLRGQPFGSIVDGKLHQREPLLRDKYYGFLLESINQMELKGTPTESQKLQIIREAAVKTATYMAAIGEKQFEDLYNIEPKKSNSAPANQPKLTPQQEEARKLLGIGGSQ